MTTIREQWNALLGRLGLASDTENGVSDKQLETLNEALAEPADTPAEETAARTNGNGDPNASARRPIPDGNAPFGQPGGLRQRSTQFQTIRPDCVK